MLTEKEIIQLINAGENSSVEFKSSEVRAEALAREIVAFSNSLGGLILLGVSDSGSIDGVDSQRAYDEWIANIARNNLLPAVDPGIHSCFINGKQIFVIDVAKGADKPYQTLDGKYLVRVGSTNRIATHAELMRLFQSSGFFHYDRNPVEKTNLNDLNFFSLDDYFSRYEIRFSEESEENKISLLTNSDIMAENGNLTVAGLLIFGINPGRHLFQAGITFAHYNGNEITDALIDKNKIEGNIGFQIDSVVSVIKNNLLTPSIIQGTKRVHTRPMFPDKVFKEIVTNAVVHRNYAIQGSLVRISMFDDRIEFESPGRLPNTVTVDKLRAGVSYSVNPVIVKFMENLRYIDQLGRGLPMVCRETDRIKAEVEFKEIGEAFKVTLFFPERR